MFRKKVYQIKKIELENLDAFREEEMGLDGRN